MYEGRGKNLGCFVGFWFGFLCGWVLWLINIGSIESYLWWCGGSVGVGEDIEFSFGCVEIEVFVDVG